MEFAKMRHRLRTFSLAVALAIGCDVDVRNKSLDSEKELSSLDSLADESYTYFEYNSWQFISQDSHRGKLLKYEVVGWSDLYVPGPCPIVNFTVLTDDKRYIKVKGYHVYKEACERLELLKEQDSIELPFEIYMLRRSYLID
jgi:hypothetical protein